MEEIDWCEGGVVGHKEVRVVREEEKERDQRAEEVCVDVDGLVVEICGQKHRRACIGGRVRRREKAVYEESDDEQTTRRIQRPPLVFVIMQGLVRTYSRRWTSSSPPETAVPYGIRRGCTPTRTPWKRTPRRNCEPLARRTGGERAAAGRPRPSTSVVASSCDLWHAVGDSSV